jgi:hypothetical protein
VFTAEGKGQPITKASFGDESNIYSRTFAPARAKAGKNQ